MLLPLGIWASSVCVLAAAVRIIPYLWDGPALMCCLLLCFPLLLVLLLLLLVSSGPLFGSWQSSSARPDMCLRSVCPLDHGGGRGWRDGVSSLSSLWFLREEV